MTVKQSDAVWQADLGNDYYQNPILQADYSDPDVIAVGGDFYLVASSFNHVPGLPLLHSRDLIHWQLLTHIVPRLPSPHYDSVQPGRGIWAPSLRYHQGMFRVYYSMPDEGIFMCETRDPAGPWSPPHCLCAEKGWIDPCPLWAPDGQVWLVHAFAYSRSQRKHQLQCLPLSADGRTIIGDGHIIYDGTADLPTLEGPKLYWRNGWYYIFAPAGGVATGWQTVLRSRSIHGPYESRTVLQQGRTAINGPHQGGWVETSQGECWFVHFQDQDLYGRVVHLQPMRWQNDWPRLGTRADQDVPIPEPVTRYRKPAGLVVSAPDVHIPASDTFMPVETSGLEQNFGLQWQWLANPQPGWVRPTSEHLALTCQPMGQDRQQLPSFYATPQLLLQKWCAREFLATTHVQPHFLQIGDECGLTVYGERYASLGIMKTAQDSWQWIFRYGWVSDAGIVTETTENMPYDSGFGPFLELQVDIRENGLCRFSSRQHIFEPSLKFAAGPGKWVGAKIGIYALNTNKNHSNTKGYAEFYDFIVSPSGRDMQPG